MSETKKNGSSVAITALSVTGLAICLYLTAIYYTTDGAGAYCSGGWQCNEVLNSKFSKMFGYPASLAGAIGYAFLSVAGAFGGLRKNRALIIGLASTGVGVSAYLSWAEFFVIRQICPFCVTSAVIILVIWILSVRGADGAKIGAGVVIAVVAAVAGYVSAEMSEDSPRVSQNVQNVMMSKGLAQHLKKTGAVMYGSFKCPACIMQKKIFGADAKKLNYVECHPEGKNAKPDLCREKNIGAFPTWEIKGSFHKGAKTLEQLSKISGYKSGRQ
ncbi:MAG: hypothetical protein GKS04_01065 [Candidatus Mycalebacterium zealandia]|nr:MAG: hypothetical protein GKS04_01065 [Candidatus Mycalebacterium zealandia]